MLQKLFPKVFDKAAKATGELIGNKIIYKITNLRIAGEIVIPQGQELLNELKQVL